MNLDDTIKEIKPERPVSEENSNQEKNEGQEQAKASENQESETPDELAQVSNDIDYQDPITQQYLLERHNQCGNKIYKEDKRKFIDPKIISASFEN